MLKNTNLEIKSRKEEGITLIALVITVIIMLILAFVAISALLNGEGLFGKTQLAADTYSKAVQNETDKITGLMNEIDSYLGRNTGDDDITEETGTDATPGELEGEGTINSPYKIASIEDLVAFSNALKNGATKYEGEYVKLIRSLDFNADDSYVNPNTTEFGDLNADSVTEGLKIELTDRDGIGFTPIGGGVNGDFKGTFDGNYKKIENLYENRADTVPVGLFGRCSDNGSIKNLEVTGEVYRISEGSSTYDTAAGVVSYISNGSVTNCINRVNVNSNAERVGGIVGCNYAGLVEGCINYGNVTATNAEKFMPATGGVIGFSQGDTYRCINYGTVEGDECVGGVVGYVGASASEVAYSYNEGNVTGNGEYTAGVVGKAMGIVSYCYNIGEAIGKDYVAGVAGYTREFISNCYNEGNITGDSYVAGIVTEYFSALSTVENCYNAGQIEGNDMVAGIVCEIESTYTNFNNCVNTGNIVYTGTGSTYGALVADAQGLTLNDSNNKYLNTSCAVGINNAGSSNEEVITGPVNLFDVIGYTGIGTERQISTIEYNGETVNIFKNAGFDNIEFYWE